MRHRKKFKGKQYMGYSVMDDKRERKGKVTEFYEPILKGVLQLGDDAVKSKMVRPVALMLSFAFREDFSDYPITNVIDRIRDTFRKVKVGRAKDDGVRRVGSRKRENTFNFKFLWVRETKYLTPRDPEFEASLSVEEQKIALTSVNDEAPIPYPHYHLILVLDDHKGSWCAVKMVMDRLVSEGIVRRGFHFSESNKSKEKTIKLRDEKEFNDYMYRASYLAKTDTKEMNGQRIWSKSR